jgi:DNA-binding response OmpR family regulator
MKILVVEDQAKLLRLLKRGLIESGAAVDCVASAAAADQAVSATRYDAVVLDLMLPDRDGLDLLREWRQRRINLPVLILSARNAVKDRVDGLELGADDYLPKPFSMDELLARLRSLTRRQPGQLAEELRHRELVMSPQNGVVTLAGRSLDLTARELALLEIFMRNIGRVVTRSMLTEKVWARDYDVSSNLLDVYMGRLRGKLELPDGRPFFETIRGLGYKLT